jgi:uncharacterized membrane protein HdeD (DUF308 family)
MTTYSQSPTGILPDLWKSTLVSGVLAVVLGVLVLSWPGVSIATAAIFFGVYLVISGAAQIVFAFSLDVLAGGRVLLFVSGAASLVLAVLAFRNIYSAVLLLAIWIGVGFLFRGVATTVFAISDPAMPGRGWTIFFGLITAIAGIVVITWPLQSIATLAVVAGVSMVIIGVMEVLISFDIRSAAKKLGKIARDGIDTGAAA